MKMKRFILILAFLLLVNSVFADDFQNSYSFSIDVDVKGGMEIVPESSGYSIKSINVNMNFFPRDSFNQKVLELDIEPESEVEDDAIKFEWKEPDEKKIDFGFNVKIETYNKLVEVKNKIDFPIKDLDNDIVIYTKPSDTIDSGNEDIIRLASELVEGEDDLYRAVFKLGDWVKDNIEYDLSTLTASVSQKASWVLDNREGVCDELTSLFIALSRAVGVPAKFVSGVAYTDSELFEEKWGAHGWAEVYFPGYGWIPFDVTYGELGFIDAGHIKMKESVDSATTSTQYEWVGRNVDLKTKGLEIGARLKGKKGRLSSFIEIEVDAVKKEVGFGSYNLIEANVRNLKDYYVSTELYFSKSEHIEIIGDFKKRILLGPKEEKQVFWIVKVSDGLKRNFIYTFPFVVVSLRNSSGGASFESERRDIIFSLEEIEGILKDREEEVEKEYSKEVELNCNIDKENFYVYEGALVSCKIKNVGNIFLDGLVACFDGDCKEFDLGIAQDNELEFPVDNFDAGKKDMVVKASNSQVTKSHYIGFDVLDEPRINIVNLEYPENVRFEDKYEVIFLLEKDSMSNPRDIEVIFEQNGLQKSWIMDELFEDRRFVINLEGDDLKAGMNDFRIFVNYEDGNDRSYETGDVFFIELVDVDLLQRAQIFLNYTGRFLNSLSYKQLMVSLFVVAGVFVFVVLFVFKKKKVLE